MAYVCPRCNYTTNAKYDFKKHLLRKNICKSFNGDISLDNIKKSFIKEKEHKYNCNICKCGFSSKKGLLYHSKNCNSNIILMSKIDELNKKINELSHTQIINNSNNSNIININSQFSLRPFGEEITDYIEHEYIENIFFVSGLNNSAFTSLLKLLHFDPEYPENHNIRIKSSKRNLLEIFRGDHWDSVTLCNGIHQMIVNGKNFFQKFYEENKNKIDYGLSSGELKNILLTFDEVEKLHNISKQIKPDIIAIMETHRNNPLIENNTLSIE